MDKFAQRRGFYSKLREKVNLTGRILEKVNPEFREIMERIREVDANVRQQASHLKKDSKIAQVFAKKGNYLAAATQLSVIHEKSRIIASELEKLKSYIESKHYKVLLEQFEPEQKKQLLEYDPNKQLEETAELQTILIKQAGLSDWWVGIQKDLAMGALGKRLTVPFFKILKSDTLILADKTSQFVKDLLDIFDDLGSAVATRNAANYIKEINIFLNKFKPYHASFVKYYQTNIVPLKEKQKGLEQEQLLSDQARLYVEDAKSREKQQQQDAQGLSEKDRKKKEFDEWKKRMITPKQPAKTDFTGRSNPLSDEKQPEDKMYERPHLQELLQEETEMPIPLTKKRSHDQFINKLESLSAHSPIKLAQAILDYSQQIEDSSPNASLKLLSVAEGILQDYKTAQSVNDYTDRWLGKNPEEKTDEKIEGAKPETVVPLE